MKIKLVTIYVDDQDKALHFYADVLGLTKKADLGNAGYRWLTVASPDDPGGAELQLARNDNPAGRAYQQAMFAAGQPVLMLFSDDIRADHARISGTGAVFKMPPTDVTGSTIAQLEDGCGNIVQITELKTW
jgi:predicted enzyme related to lactoylglutathione lyase